ncbi:hypothetical protein CAPTEDRAFT_205867 [Capitella teleta]|uniref:Uncharacterized protein n=1 Tax=Capitella teleta TaxID=283909 RepID=R7TV37_CAPTE|nr:hypothetical protein CAPTEDRAFT_205867 [Capitella teleta]|eukprot:ELT97589.1 hypothetical protein CAPTEDRAFT_205867 [Capitella teleta]
MRIIKEEEAELKKIYEEVRRMKAPSQLVRESMDRATTFVSDVTLTLSEVLGSLIGPFDQEERMTLANQLAEKPYARSVYGSTVSRVALHNEEQLKLRAELTAKEAESRNADAIEAQRVKLQGLELAAQLEQLKEKLRVYEMADESSHSVAAK